MELFLIVSSPSGPGLFQIHYKDGVFNPLTRITPNDGVGYRGGVLDGCGIVYDPAGFTHLFYIGVAAGPVFAGHHQTVDALGNVGAQQTFAGMTTANIQFGTFPIIFKNELLVPYIGDDGKPRIWRAPAGQQTPVWTSQLVSNDVIPFPNPNSTQPTITADPVTGTLHYFYPFADFATVCQIRHCTNTGSGWSAPSVFFDDAVNPPTNDPGVASQSPYHLGSFWMNGGISLIAELNTTAIGLDDMAVNTVGTPTGHLVRVDDSTFFPLDNNQAAFFFNGKTGPAWYAYSVQDRVGATPENMRVWKSTDGGNTWTMLALLTQDLGIRNSSPQAVGIYPGFGQYIYFSGFLVSNDPLKNRALTVARFDMLTETFDIIDATGPLRLTTWEFNFLLAAPVSPPPPVVTPINAQLIFQGVRRQKGTLPRLVPGACFSRKSFTITQKITINSTGTFPAELQAAAPQTLVQPVYDYDFEWHELRITYQSAGILPKIVCAVFLYDVVKNQLSNLPVLDVYYNGAPLTKYENGAQVPPLLFPANSEIRVDIWSLIQDASVLPITATFHFVGHRLILA